jgi:hypothetical protein
MFCTCELGTIKFCEFAETRPGFSGSPKFFLAGLLLLLPRGLRGRKEEGERREIGGGRREQEEGRRDDRG